MAQQVEWDKIQDLRNGNLYMTLPNSEHFKYLAKFLQPLLIEPIPHVKGIVSLSCLMSSGDEHFRVVTYWPIMNIRISMNEEDWIMALGGELK